MADGLDDARDAFAEEIPQASRPRDQSGRFVSTSGRPEPIFQPRDIEGDPLTGDKSDGGDDPRWLEHERKVADGRSEERDEDNERRAVSNRAAKSAGAAADEGGDERAEGERELARRQEADSAGQDLAKSDQGAGSEPEVAEDESPRYRIQVDGEEREVSLNEALRGYVREETFNTRMAKMVEVAKAVDHKAAEAAQARDAYIQLCANQEQEFAALIPAEPNWDEMYRVNPAGAHALENNYKAVYGTLNTIRQRRAYAQQQAYADAAQRTAGYSQAEWTKFCQKNKLADQAAIDKAIAHMRRTALAAGFVEDEISTTHDERMLSVLFKAAKYDNMMAQRPVPVQPERGSSLAPGSAPRIGNGAARSMNDAQKRLAASGRVDDAALVMAQFLRR